MEITEAKKTIDYLKSVLYKTRSNKRKIHIMSDIMSLEHYIHITDPNYSSKVFYGDTIYQAYKDQMIKERVDICNEILRTNDDNNMIASHLLCEYEDAEFIPFLFDQMKIVDKKRSYELLRDFMGYMGPLAIKKYNELIKNESILTMPMAEYGGVCWDFPTLDKQVVVSDINNGEYNLMAIAHEIGHAIHFEKLNGIGRRRIEHNSLVESMSMLFEEEFIDFGLENGMDFDVLRNYVYSQRVPDALSVKMSTLLIDKAKWVFNGTDIIFDQFDLDEIDMEDNNYAYLANQIKDSLDYIDPLYYLLGFTMTEKLHSESIKGKDAVNEMLEILLKSELCTHEEIINQLDLIHFEFPNLKDNLIKNSNNLILKN